ncbi:MAG: TetR/AcrR family transcriptional regulator [Mycobacterium sp.]
MGTPRTPAQPRPVPPTPQAARRIRGLDAEQRRAQRREQLLAAAFEPFARDGYASTSIEQICQTAYVGNKAFYELFDSKEDCYLALLRQLAERVEQQVSQALQQSADEEEEEAVHRLLSAFAHALVDDPRIAVVSFGEGAGISPRVEAQRRENRRWAASFLEAFWRHNQPTGDGTRRDDIDYHVLAVATIGGLFEAVADWLHGADPPLPRTIDSLIADLTTFMSVVEAGITTRGLLSRPAGVVSTGPDPAAR